MSVAALVMVKRVFHFAGLPRIEGPAFFFSGERSETRTQLKRPK
jgi:hypothetical protein